MSEKISSIRGIIDQPTEPDVGINLFPDGNQVDIDIDRTTLKVTKSSFNITIGRFSISLNNKETENPSPDHSSDRELTRQTSIFVISVHTGHPLLVVKEEDSTSVTADISFTYAARRDHLHLVDTRSTGQGNRSTLTASKNNYFLAVDITGSVKVLERDSNNANNQQLFEQHHLGNNEVRFSVELEEGTRYLRAKNDVLDTVPESEIGTQDEETRFLINPV